MDSLPPYAIYTVLAVISTALIVSTAFYCATCYGTWARQKKEARHE